MVKVKLMCFFNSFNLIRENSEVVRLGRFNSKVHKLKFYSEWRECIDFELIQKTKQITCFSFSDEKN